MDQFDPLNNINNDNDLSMPEPRAEKSQRNNKAGNRKTTKPTRRQPGIVRFFKDSRTHKFFGIVLLLIATAITVVCLSHIHSAAADQSEAINRSVLEMSDEPNEIQNVGGPLGAKVSYLFISQWFGLGAIAFIVYFAILGLGLLGSKRISFWSLTFKTLLFAISSSIILGLLTYNLPTEMFWGGMHGHYVNHFLFSTTGFIGPVLVSVLLASAIVLIYINDLAAIYQNFKEKQATVRHRQEMEEEKEEYENNRVAEALDNSIIDNEPVEPDEPVEPVNPITNKNPYLEPENDMDTTVVANDLDNYPISETVVTPYPSTTISGPGNQGFSIDEETTPSHNAIQLDTTITTPQHSTSHENQAPTTLDNVTVTEIEEADADSVDADLYDPTAELSRYRKPPIDLLNDIKSTGQSVDKEELEDNKQQIIKTLLDYNIAISSISATVGPTVTLFEIIPAEGVRIAQIKRLEDDIARSLAAIGIRIIAPIPGKGTVGIEVPNREPQTVSMRSILNSRKYTETKARLPMAMGATIENEVFIEDLTKMPHLLVAGATGQGKSVGLNAIIASLIYKKHPSELKFVLIDPKMVEFSLYGKLERHFLAKLPDEDDAIITDPEKVKLTLNSLCVEMDNRYALLKDAYVRSLEEYNAKFVARKLNPDKGHKYLPYIVVIVDEFADLIMMAGKEVEMPIARIAQKARAVGIHMIIATQRPSTNVITGIIKANFPGRIAFKVSQMVDSKTILDRTGANQLIGRGDMLFSHNGKLDRVQCAFISTEEVESICDWIDEQVGYEHAYYLPECLPDAGAAGSGNNFSDKDQLFDEIARFVVASTTASTSSLQRRYSIGYNRAGKIMDQLEAAGIVGPSQGGKPRAILVDSVTLERILANG